MNYGKSFKHYRQNANLTQKEAAELIGVKDYQLGNYETNRSQPNLDVLKKMSGAYRVSIDKMLGNHHSNADSTKQNDYVDIDELLTELNDVVEKVNSAKKNGQNK